MSSPTVSVVIPAYNAEPFIERTIESVFQQTYDDWELVVVENGSQDRTPEILEELVNKYDDRYILINNPEGGGESVGRNIGIAHAKGKWIHFLDADDEFTPSRLEDMMSYASDDVDVIVCDHEMVLPDGTSTVRRQSCSGDLPGEVAGRFALEDRVSPFVWDKGFRAYLFDDNEHPVGMRSGADGVVSTTAVYRARKVRFAPIIGYKYYIMQSSVTWRSVLSLDETEEMPNQLAARIGRDGMTPELDRALTVNRASAFLKVAGQHAMVNEPIDAPPAMSRFSWSDVLKAGRVNFKVGLAAALAKLSPRIYGTFYRRYARKVYALGS